MQILLSCSTHAVSEMNVIWVASVDVSLDDLVDRQWSSLLQLFKESRLAVEIGLGQEQPNSATN